MKKIIIQKIGFIFLISSCMPPLYAGHISFSPEISYNAFCDSLRASSDSEEESPFSFLNEYHPTFDETLWHNDSVEHSASSYTVLAPVLNSDIGLSDENVSLQSMPYEDFSQISTISTCAIEPAEPDNNVDVADNKTQSTIKIKSAFICSIFGCDYQTLQRKRFQDHSLTHTDATAISCEHKDCTFKSTDHSALRTHVCNHHKKIEDITPEEKIYICDHPNCGFQTKYSDHLDSHKLTHGNGAKSCLQKECHFKTTYVVAFKEHMRMFHPEIRRQEKTFRCLHFNCNYETTHRYYLKAHERHHYNPKPFTCDHFRCKYRAISHSNLERHKLTHSENATSCDQRDCSFKSTDPRAFIAHMEEFHPGAIIKRVKRQRTRRS